MVRRSLDPSYPWTALGNVTICELPVGGGYSIYSWVGRCGAAPHTLTLFRDRSLFTVGEGYYFLEKWLKKNMTLPFNMTKKIMTLPQRRVKKIVTLPYPFFFIFI